MAHFAQVDENNTVTEVLVIDQTEIDTGNWGDPATFVKTSYNTRGGVYYTPNTNTPDSDQSKAFRKNYAGIGGRWIPDGPDGEGFAPAQPYPSWTLNPATYWWEPPTPMPAQPWPEGVIGYEWNESTTSWTPVYQFGGE